MPTGVYKHHLHQGFKKGHKFRFKKGHMINNGRIPWNKGKKASEETRKKLRLAHLGKSFLTKRKRFHIKHPRSIEYRIKLSESHRGVKSNFWKGGIGEKNKRIRKSIEFRLWREAVFARNNWTCQECGAKGGVIHPHHIKEFAKFPELRFAIDNGQTLCIVCHQLKHKVELSVVK